MLPDNGNQLRRYDELVLCLSKAQLYRSCRFKNASRPSDRYARKPSNLRYQSVSARPLLDRLFRRSGAKSDAGDLGDSRRLQDYIIDFAASSEDAERYVRTHLGRLVRTLQLTPRAGAGDRVLEMGAYMQITPALKGILGYSEVRGCYLGPLGTTDQKAVTSRSGQSFSCAIDLFDAERDSYPYQDGFFASVICAELLEHLSLDPMHLLQEVNRILREGGHFILGTPNICSIRSVARVLHGEHPGLYQQYIRPRNGVVDPRHAREYAPVEVRRLLEAAGFRVEILETGPYGLESPQPDRLATRILARNSLPLDLRGETIHAVAVKTGPVKVRFPAWLYD